MMLSENTTKFSPAQTPQARSIQSVALWIAERIDTGMTAEDMILARNTLLSQAAGVEELENNVCAAAQAGGAA